MTSHLTHATPPEYGALFLLTGGLFMFRLKMLLTSFKSSPNDRISSRCFTSKLDAIGSLSSSPSKLSKSLKVAVIVVQSSKACSHRGEKENHERATSSVAI